MAPLKPTGFWSYTSADDAASDGRLSRLRTQLANRLRVQLGRPVHLFQDVAAIPPGTLWEQQIESALAESSFFIPILTPGFLQSEWCAREVRRFREHMEARGRDDLILPVHYLDVTGFSTVRRGDCFDPAMLDYLRSLQWVDFRRLEPLDSDITEVRVWLGEFARRIEEALYRAVPQRPALGVQTKLQTFSEKEWINFPIPAPTAASKRRRPVMWGAAGIAALAIVLYGTREVLTPAVSPVTSVPDKSASAAADASPSQQTPPPATNPAPNVPHRVQRLGDPSAAADSSPPQPDTAAGPPPPKEFRDNCPANAICPEMVLIPHGSFQMGTTDEELERENVPKEYRGWEKPRHPVTIGADFYLGKYAVTLGEFKAFVHSRGPRPAGGCYNWEERREGKFSLQFKQDRVWDHPGFPQTDRDPVVCVSYDDAVAYVDWLNLVTGTKAYRLPSEAEWEYAARAGTTTSRFWGDARDPACRFANVADLSLAKHDGIETPDPERYFNCSDGFVFTAPAGSFHDNAFGLYDMLGNAWQWTADCWNDDEKDAPSNGATRITGDCSRRVVRGGAWYNSPWDVRAGNRGWYDAGSRVTLTGFRVARTL